MMKRKLISLYVILDFFKVNIKLVVVVVVFWGSRGPGLAPPSVLLREGVSALPVTIRTAEGCLQGTASGLFEPTIFSIVFTWYTTHVGSTKATATSQH